MFWTLFDITNLAIVLAVAFGLFFVLVIIRLRGAAHFDPLGSSELLLLVIAAVAAILLTAILIIPPQSEQGEHITVLAAASMQNALDEVNAAFTKSTGVKVTARDAASSALMKQIAQGAEADVFVSADLDWMDFGSKKKLIKDDTRVNLLGNQLVLIAPNDSKLD